MPLGRLVAAHKITDGDKGQSWYPPMILDFPCDTASLLTVEKERHDYPNGELVEMEASGFYAAASRFSSHELIHCLKVVSDNNSQKKLDGKSVKNMIAAQLDAVQSVVNQLLQLSAQLQERQAPPLYLKQFLEQWKFSATQQHQLEKMLGRWKVVYPGTNPLEYAAYCGTGKDALRILQGRLSETLVKTSLL